MYTRKTLTIELLKLNSLDEIRLTVHQDGVYSEMNICVYFAIRLTQMLPNSKTRYDYFKLSD